MRLCERGNNYVMKTSIIAEQTGLKTSMVVNYWQAVCHQGFSTFKSLEILLQAH